MLVKNLKAEIPGFGSINLAEKLRPTSQDLGHPPHGAWVWVGFGKLGLAQFRKINMGHVELMAAI